MGMARPERLFINGESASIERLGLGVLALFLED
jgi:hypothetical protein